MKRIAEYARNAAPGFIGGFLGIALTASVAEYIRLEIQKDGYPTPVEKVFSMEESTYHQFPIEWKQLLAQVAMEPQMYAGHTVQFLSTLSVKQAALIGKLSAHVLGGDFLIRDNNNASKHHIAGVTLHEFLNLEALGFLQTVATGLNMTIGSNIQESFRNVIRATSHVLSIEQNDSSRKLQLAVTTLTTSGKEIVALLRKPSNLEHLAWVAQHINAKGFETRLWASWTPTDPATGEWQAKYPITLEQ